MPQLHVFENGDKALFLTTWRVRIFHSVSPPSLKSLSLARSLVLFLSHARSLSLPHFIPPSLPPSRPPSLSLACAYSLSLARARSLSAAAPCLLKTVKDSLPRRTAGACTHTHTKSLTHSHTHRHSTVKGSYQRGCGRGLRVWGLNGMPRSRVPSASNSCKPCCAEEGRKRRARELRG